MDFVINKEGESITKMTIIDAEGGTCADIYDLLHNVKK